MKRIMILVLVTALCVMGFALERTTQDAGRRTQEIVIVKTPSKEPRNPYQEEYENLLYPTVRITARFATGSGVIFTTKHTKDTKKYIYILTAAHVVGDENTVSIELYPQDIKIDAEVVITDTTKDLSLLRVLCDLCGKSIYSASLAPESYQAYLFTPVYTVGCSLGLLPRPSRRVVGLWFIP